MTLLVPDVGELEMLNRILKEADNCVLKLYSNNHTPTEADTKSSYTELTASYGYGDRTLTMSGWTVASVASVSTGSFTQRVWTFTGAQGNVYGYYVLDAAETVLLWAERFTDGPYNIQNNGDVIKVTPKITLE